VISAVDVGTMGGTTVIMVGGAVVTIEATSGGWDVDSPCFSLRAFSNACSISLNLSFYLISRSIMSSCNFCCITSVVCGCIVMGSFSCFLRAAMCSSFYFINAFMPLASLGSCPSSIIISSKDLILLSLAREEAFSKSS